MGNKQLQATKALIGMVAELVAVSKASKESSPPSYQARGMVRLCRCSQLPHAAPWHRWLVPSLVWIAGHGGNAAGMRGNLRVECWAPLPAARLVACCLCCTMACMYCAACHSASRI